MASPPASTEEASMAQLDNSGSGLTTDQWSAIKYITERIYIYRTDDGHDPSKVFQRKVNRRVLPDYYDVIKDPIALSTMKFKILHRGYTSFEQYVRDAALISHNAQTYNRPEAGAYRDALTVKELFQKEFQTLVEQGIITAEVAQYPDLGDLPPVEDLPPLPDGDEEDEDEEDEEEEGEEDDDEEDEDDDGDGREDTEDEGGKRRRGRVGRPGRPPLKRQGTAHADRSKGGEVKRKRGRPPKVDTPMEARIKNVLKSIRRVKNAQGQIMSLSFEKLPDKSELPDYYLEIKEPIAIEQIKRKAKRKKYQSIDHLLRDLDLMFENCKSYNLDDSQVYQDAVALQTEARKAVDEEKSKPDTDYALEEGRLPLPNGITHSGESWKVGDWVHIQNPNDVTKPTVAQLYRTWQDSNGEKWVNACWYYRPEQTVHHFEKHFFPHEVVKTGHYRDHRVDEIVDRCFVMFVTRYGRGRPRGLGPGREIYICESRYNEEKYKMNKIKTWASCLPDEVRDKDYEMDLFDHARRIRKVPSPLLHLLNDDTSVTNAKPRWGAENAPPVVGAVFKGPRDENQSPPPRSSPSPPRSAPLVNTKLKANMALPYNKIDLKGESPRINVSSGPHANNVAPYNSSTPLQHHQSSSSAVPMPHPYQQPHYNPTIPATSSDPYTAHQTRYAPPRATTAGPGQSRPDEVYRLPENANLAIPEDVRNQFQQDENGHILFFTAPPVDVLPSIKPGSAVGHTARFLAAGLPNRKIDKQKRTADTSIVSDAKKVKSESREDSDLADRIEETKKEAFEMLIGRIENGTTQIYQDVYGTSWDHGKQHEANVLQLRQAEAKQKLEAAEERRRWRVARRDMATGPGRIFKDDWNPRY